MLKEVSDTKAATEGGWLVVMNDQYPSGKHTVYWHNGYVWGGTSISMLRSDGLGAVLIYNQGTAMSPDPEEARLYPKELQYNAQGYELLRLAEQVVFSATEDLFTDVGYARLDGE